MKINDDIYIKLLKFGEKNPEGFNKKKIIENIEFGLSEWEKKLIDKHLLHAFYNTRQHSNSGYPNLETLFLLVDGESKPSYDNDNCRYLINLDSRFKYIDYEELVSARKSSRNAIIIATISVLLTLFGFCMTYIFFKTQMHTPIKIDMNQFQEITKLKFQSESLEKKIDDLISEQSSTTQILINQKNN